MPNVPPWLLLLESELTLSFPVNLPDTESVGRAVVASITAVTSKQVWMAFNYQRSPLNQMGPPHSFKKAALL